jgi:hypothetical protein
LAFETEVMKMGLQPKKAMDIPNNEKTRRRDRQER